MQNFCFEGFAAQKNLVGDVLLGREWVSQSLQYQKNVCNMSTYTGTMHVQYIPILCQ